MIELAALLICLYLGLPILFAIIEGIGMLIGDVIDGISNLYYWVKEGRLGDESADCKSRDGREFDYRA